MTKAQILSPAVPGNRIPKFTAFLFGAVAYLTFLFTILYAIGFVSGLAVPKTIDTGAKAPAFEAIFVNLGLMSLFALQHSVMARKSFKQWWTRFTPAGAGVPDAVSLWLRPAPDLSRLHHRVLGHPDDDRRAPAVRGRDHRLHLRRLHVGGA